MLDAQAARKELEGKSILDIERATALTWGNRAAACYALAHEAPDDATRTRRLEEAQNYRQEAIEHAAMTEDFAFLKALVKDLARHEAAAKPGGPRPAGRAVRASRRERP